MKALYYLKYTCLLLIFISSLNTSSAATIFGSHIGYKKINAVTYEVTLIIYRDCNGVPLTTPVITVTGKSSGPYNSTTTKVSTTDVTGAYLNCSFVSRCNGSFPYGIQEEVYIDTVDVTGGVCRYVVSYSECCRNSSITTGAANTNHYNEAVIDRCLGNNSVQADIKPFFLLPVGQDITLSTFIGDRSTDEDSVSYSLVSVLSGAGTPITYGSIFSATKPLTFLGFPSNSIPPPAGFSFDSNTGEIRFRPTKANEVSVLCVEAKEYRRINGIMEEAGITRLEFTVIVVNSATNSTPKIQGKNALACNGQKTCIDIETSDGDAADSSFVNIDFLPSGATVTYSFNGKNAKAQVCWTPTLSDVREKPYTFLASVSDDNCLLSGRSTRIFSYTVRKTPDANAVDIVSKTVQCSSAEIVVNIKSSSPNSTFTLMDEDSISFDTKDTSRLYFKGSGWKKFYLILKSQAPCTYTHVDSVFIAPQYNLQLNTKADSAICPYDSISIYTKAVSGTAPFSYYWASIPNTSPQPQTASFYTKINSNSTFRVFVKDSNNCVAFDTVKISLNPMPYIDAGETDTVCPLVPFMLTATPDSGVQVSKYDWKGLDTLQTVTAQISNNTSQWYSVTATNQYGCTYTDSTQIKLFAIGVYAGNYPPVCAGTSLQLKATANAGVAPFTYNWVGTNINTNVVNIVVNKDTAIVVRIQDTLGCFAYDTAWIKANPLPTFIAPPNTNICKGQSQVLRIDSIKGTAPHIIRWNGVVASSTYTVSPQQTTNYTIVVSDSNLCATAQTIRVIVFNSPVVDLGLDRTVCKNQQINANAFIIGGQQPYSYLWSDGSTGTSITKTVNSPQSFSVRVTDDNGCIDRDTISFSVFPTQKATLTPIGTLCENDPPIGLKAIPNTGVWSGSGVNTNLFIPQLAKKGKQYIKYEFLSVDNCPEKDSIFVNVKQIPVPNFTVDKTAAKPGVQFNFTNQTIADTTYTSVWDMGDTAGVGNIITTQNASYTYSANGRYTVKLSVYNGVCPLQTVVKNQYILVDNSLLVAETKNNIISIYPNPSTGGLTIDAESPFTAIEVFDVLGKKVWGKTNTNSQHTQIELTHLAAGTYTLKLSLANGAFTHSAFIITK